MPFHCCWVNNSGNPRTLNSNSLLKWARYFLQSYSAVDFLWTWEQDLYTFSCASLTAKNRTRHQLGAWWSPAWMGRHREADGWRHWLSLWKEAWPLHILPCTGLDSSFLFSITQPSLCREIYQDAQSPTYFPGELQLTPSPLISKRLAPPNPSVSSFIWNKNRLLQTFQFWVIGS